MTPVVIKGLTKKFGKTIAVDHVDLNIPAGQLFFLLGPSGCGKTTLLRMIAGFTDPSSGSIQFGEKEVTATRVEKRNTAMVFQGYALWPHMSVRANVAFGLDVRKLPSAEKKRRVDEALKQARIFKLAERKPNELSGGQQQRVALARALVIEPTVLLLDEPLSNLDAKLRLQMRREIKTICQNAGITAIYVTHDQKEALSMADQIAVMKEGKIVQVDSPQNLYRQSKDRFVVDFLGVTNFISAEVIDGYDNKIKLQTACGEMESKVFPANLPANGNVTCSIRPEAMKIISGDISGKPLNHFTAQYLSTTYLGEMAEHELLVDGSIYMRAYELNPSLNCKPETKVQVMVEPEDVVILRD